MAMASIKKALIAGVMGSVAMTAFSYFAKVVNLPHSDYQTLFTGRFGGDAGWFAFMGTAVILAYLYGHTFRKKLPFHSWKRGAAFAVGLWAVVQAVLMPILGQGFFPGTIITAFGAILTLAAYGATVGYLYEH